MENLVVRGDNVLIKTYTKKSPIIIEGKDDVGNALEKVEIAAIGESVEGLEKGMLITVPTRVLNSAEAMRERLNIEEEEGINYFFIKAFDVLALIG